MGRAGGPLLHDGRQPRRERRQQTLGLCSGPQRRWQSGGGVDAQRTGASPAYVFAQRRNRMTDMHGDGTMLRLRHDRSARRQRGVSVVALLLLVALVGGIGTLAVRLIPHYIDYGTIVSLVEELPADQVHKMA